MSKRSHTLLSRWLVPAVTALGLLATGPALAVDNLKLLVPAAPGGGWDQTGRGLAQAMQANNIVKRIQIDNKPGASGIIGLAQFATSAKGDPHATMMGGSVMVGGIALSKSPVSMTQLTPIARLSGEYDALVVPANSPIKSLKDLIEQFKANPGSVSWGGGGIGGTDHIIVAMIAQAVGVDVSKVNYVTFAGGGEAQVAILGGHVTVGVSGVSEFAGQIANGRLRPLAVTSGKRLPGVDAPTLKEQGVDVELANWRAIFAAPGINEAQKKDLVAVVDNAVRTRSWQDLLAKNGWTDMYMPGDAFKNFLEQEIRQTEKIINGLGLAGKK